MYDLINFSEQELRAMSEAFAMSIENKKGLIEQYGLYGDDISRLMKGNRDRLQGDITVLREMNVRALTALQIVRDRQTVNSN